MYVTLVEGCAIDEKCEGRTKRNNENWRKEYNVGEFSWEEWLIWGSAVKIQKKWESQGSGKKRKE